MNILISINEASKRLGVFISARLYGSQSKKNKKVLETVKAMLE